MTVGIAGVPEDGSVNCWCTEGWKCKLLAKGRWQLELLAFPKMEVEFAGVSVVGSGNYWCIREWQWELLVYQRMAVGIAGVPEDDRGNC